MGKKITVRDVSKELIDELSKKILKLKNINRQREVMFEELLHDFKTPELRDSYRIMWNLIEDNKDEEGK